MIRPIPSMLATIFALGSIAGLAETALPPERSVSSSRQFVVYGGEARLRGAICDLAEQTKRDTLRLLGGRDNWQTPIVIHARSPEINRPAAPLAELRVNQTGAGLKFQLELRLPAEISVPQIEREVLRAVLLEMIYRLQPNIPAGTPVVEPPEWLLDGIPLLAPEFDAAPVAETLATVVAGEMMSLQDFLQQKRRLLDFPSQQVYRAYAGALVSLLVEGPSGRARLSRYVADLDQASNDPFADLTAHFPALGKNSAQVETTWRAGVERFAGSERYRVLSCEETERQLAEILRINIPSATGRAVFALEEFAEFRRDPAAPAELKRLTTELLLLSGRANPLYRPILAEYQRIAAQLLRRKAPRARRLAELRAAREDLSRRLNAIADYLNWFEATQPQVASGRFREYLRAAEEAMEPVPRRRDPISVYLDALETQF